MVGLTNFQWALIACAAVLYLLTCVRVALALRRIRKNPVLWFLITLFFTAIPASLYIACRRFKMLGARGASGAGEQREVGPAGEDERRAAIRRCRHCGAVITAREEPAPDGLQLCPECKQAIDEDYLA